MHCGVTASYDKWRVRWRGRKYHDSRSAGRIGEWDSYGSEPALNVAHAGTNGACNLSTVGILCDVPINRAIFILLWQNKNRLDIVWFFADIPHVLVGDSTRIAWKLRALPAVLVSVWKDWVSAPIQAGDWTSYFLY